ncbi:hypothetical protein FisN_1Lu556 [Fistulifera solaris]|uniref:Uncharacterized protein n=1 Tax=Fistulifera solaris TaxID=1519565 RepID=A0A1Z5K106_FISSO|nr:hypothetical protein FisN_1Lu556 [Fistulifera solaris]|eukprot:GAX19980.1 hypothetical protein FisN_1Lu556 [Fistulifera solaris]
MMSSFHSNISSIRREGPLRRTIFSREHFPKFLLVINFFSCYAGYSFMERIHRDDELRLQKSILLEENLPKQYDATRRFTIVARHSPEQTQTEPLL